MFTTKVIRFESGEQIGVYNKDELILVANWKDNKASNIEFTDPKYQKNNKTRQAAIRAIEKAQVKS